ncbi:MAG: UvrD-helicase domain-containing protein [Bacilli bacterium]|nr:UvrD-helicase domain-containing protein [Bacilli bacterium]MDD4282323.1 UvrD-helicase domain-containing protein [Bacilli bacterium]MDD4718327.1 UvrD-helicase domain-containing protein [Bacilli bacterium]
MHNLSFDKVFIKKYENFITNDKYISKRDLENFIKDEQELIKKTKHNVYYSNDVNKALDIINNISGYVNKHNEVFIKRKLIEEKDYFDKMFKNIDNNIKLDTEQRIAILTEEDYSMIIAGAGSGKTTTMAAKVKYLVERLNIDPNDIMLISYTNKAVDELKQRINNDFKIPVKVCTFHKFGLEILKQNNDEPIKVLTNSYNIISDYFSKELCHDNEKLKEFLYFFIYYFDIPTFALKFDSLDEYHKFKRRNDYITLKSRLGEYNKEVIDNRTKNKYTIRGEFLRSSEEVMIANFLYLHNIEYDYEKPYPYMNKGKIYLPDFTIYFGEKTYYLEHYGINEFGNNNRYNYIENMWYRKGIAYKSRLHDKHKTNLMATYSRYEDGEDLITHLKEELEKNGIVLRKKDDKEIYDQLSDSSKDIYYMRFILFCMDFLSSYKSRGFKLEAIDKFINKYQDDKRTVMFLTFFKDLYKYYETELKINNLIDFDDMINNSYDLLKSIKKDCISLNYKYIIIDEYQDISIQRFNLTKEVSRLSDAKVIAVGDDWQAVFAFAGSDVTLFTEFKKLMGYGEELQITNTYRNSQELIDIAGKFVMKNSKQIKKKLKAQKRLSKPVVIVNYDEDEHKSMSRANTVNECLKNIVDEYGEDSSILLIGRYNFDKYHLFNTQLFYEYEQDKIKSVNFPKVKITFLTAHSSKGLGFDNVIIINGSEGVYGFPSQIKNDPILDIISVDDNSFKFAEERRLFYVALTRTKNKVYIITPNNNPSSFLVELKDYPNVSITDNKNKNFGLKENLCPVCNHPLVKDSFNNLNIANLYVCSNEKELCDFKTNSLVMKRNIISCSECEDGFLIVKQNKKDKIFFLGCTNYKKGCNNVKSIR